MKFVKNLVGITASGDNCVLATKSEDEAGQYALTLCNSIGIVIFHMIR